MEEKTNLNPMENWIVYIDLPELNQHILEFVHDQVDPIDLSIHPKVNQGNSLPKSSHLILLQNIKTRPSKELLEQMKKSTDLKLQVKGFQHLSMDTGHSLNSYDLLYIRPKNEDGKLARLFEMIQTHGVCGTSPQKLNVQIPAMFLKYGKGQVYTESTFGPHDYLVKHVMFYDLISSEKICAPLSIEDEPALSLFNECCLM